MSSFAPGQRIPLTPAVFRDDSDAVEALNSYSVPVCIVNDLDTADVVSVSLRADGRYDLVCSPNVSNGDRVQVRWAVVRATGGAATIWSDVFPVDQLVDSRSTLTTTQVTTAVEQALDTYDPPTKAELDALQAHGDAAWSTATDFPSEEQIAVAVDARLLDAGDATDLIASIVTRIGNTNVDQASFVAAVKAALFNADSADHKLAVNASGEVALNASGVRDAIGLPTADLGSQLTGIAVDAGQAVTSANTAATNAFTAVTAIANVQTGVGNLQTRLGLPANGTIANDLTAIRGVTAKLDATLIDDAGTWKFTGEALELSPSASGLSTDQEAKLDSILAATSAGVNITFQTPILEGDALIELVRGDSYAAADGRQLAWTISSHGLDLTGAAVAFTLHDPRGEAEDVLVPGAVAEDGADATFSFELTDSQTAALPPGNERLRFDVQLTLAAGRKITPIRGKASVLPQYTA
ncbi:MAG: hypothetical protein AAGE65_09540 [Planctomycetota bacterium]